MPSTIKWAMFGVAALASGGKVLAQTPIVANALQFFEGRPNAYHWDANNG